MAHDVFAIETVEHAGRRTAALAVAGGHVPLDVDLATLLARWDSAWPELVRRSSEAPVAGLDAVPQYGAARKVICAGANYYKHLVEMNVSSPKNPTKPPFYFLKPPTALAAPGRTLPLERGITKLDWEVELVAVVGRGGRNITVGDALGHVAGYTVAIDVTARDRLFDPDTIFKFDFLAGKGRDGYCPIANGFVPAALLGDPQRLHLRLAVNGVTKQDSSTDDMIYSVAELIAWISRTVTLEPGDLLLTGSPAGVGAPRGEFLAAGDVMRVELVPHLAFDVEVYAAEDAP